MDSSTVIEVWLVSPILVQFAGTEVLESAPEFLAQWYHSNEVEVAFGYALIVGMVVVSV